MKTVISKRTDKKSEDSGRSGVAIAIGGCAAVIAVVVVTVLAIAYMFGVVIRFISWGAGG